MGKTIDVNSNIQISIPITKKSRDQNLMSKYVVSTGVGFEWASVGHIMQFAATV